MHNIATIYRFKTPLLDVNDENKKLKEIFWNIENYLQSEGLKLVSKYIKWNTYNFKVLWFDNIWKIIFSSLKKTDNIVLPIFKMDIFFNVDFYINHKKEITDFLTNIFECFDGVNEKEYLIDIDKSIYYKNWFFWKKAYPYYDFQDLDSIDKIFKSKWWVQILEDFIKKYHNWFVLNMKTSKEYHQVNAYLLYLFYLLYTLYQNIYWIKKNLDFIDKSSDNMYAGHIKLQKERLKVLWWDTIKIYEKYLSFLIKFIELFEK